MGSGGVKRGLALAVLRPRPKVRQERSGHRATAERGRERLRDRGERVRDPAVLPGRDSRLSPGRTVKNRETGRRCAQALLAVGTGRARAQPSRALAQWVT